MTNAYIDLPKMLMAMDEKCKNLLPITINSKENATSKILNMRVIE